MPFWPPNTRVYFPLLLTQHARPAVASSAWPLLSPHAEWSTLRTATSDTLLSKCTIWWPAWTSTISLCHGARNQGCRRG
uniref:Uncharacterized protein n=1 Tax=Anguilla anguilla TaxID=7936 RepID=A0A0E9XGH7_ANGAN